MPMRWRFVIGTLLTGFLFAAGCSKSSGGSGDEPAPAVPDGWELTEWHGDKAIAGLVYLQFADGRFTLYQRIGDLSTAGYTVYTGSYTLTEDSAQGRLLSGAYSDGEPWLDSYVVEAWTGSELRLRAISDEIVSVYTKVVIPNYVKEAPVSTASLSAASRGGRSGVPFL